MISTIIAFLVLLNPFALFLYLGPIMKDLSSQDFMRLLIKATFISFVISVIFLFAGNFLFDNVLQIRFESFRIFGGIILFSFAYLFIVKGNQAIINMKEDLDDLASEIALPFMIGAGTIALTILMSKQMNFSLGIISLIIIFSLNHGIIVLLKIIRDSIDKKRFRIAFDKNLGILLRINGFFIGAIGINMIVTGISVLFFS